MTTAAATPESPAVPQPLPRIARFEQLGYGMFLHWGIYSQLGRGEWVQHRGDIPLAEYRKLKDTFTAEDFDADAWAQLAVDAGMKYMCLTTRHHDGFSLYDTRGLNDYDAPHSAAGRDLVAEYIDACRRHDLLPMLYHTTLDWQWRDRKTFDLDQAEFDAYLQYLNDSVEVLCANYGPIGGLWFDGNWSRREMDWKEGELYATIRKHQPEAMIINNTGLSHRGATGHPEIDAVTFEQGTPSARDQAGKPKYLTGEMCQTMNMHWGVGDRDFNYKSPAEIIETLAKCRKVGANYLLNVGPLAQGGIPVYEGAALRRTGDWVRLAGEVLYTGKPMPGVKCPGDDFMLETDDADYYFTFNLARKGSKHVTIAGGGEGPRAFQGYDRTIRRVTWVDSGEALDFAQDATASLATFNATGYPYGTDMVVRLARIER